MTTNNKKPPTFRERLFYIYFFNYSITLTEFHCLSDDVHYSSVLQHDGLKS